MAQPSRFVLLLPIFLISCASTSPRFEQALATTFAQDDMRHLVTRDVDVYYPAAHRDAAMRVVERAGECVRALRAMQFSFADRGPALLFLTSANFNNAYVYGQQRGEPMHSLNPLFVTDELFHWYGFGATEPGDISCHEMFHYAHYEQVENLWWVVNAVFGPVMPPQAFLERWFTEGVAQYYEGRIGRHVGRPASPLYRAAFESFVAERKGHLGAGDLSLYQRELLPYSGAYLTSLYFIEWLAQAYGEAKLWQLMALQGRSVFSPFGAALRYRTVYGQSLGALIDEWSDHLRRAYSERARPADQRVLRTQLGQLARLSTHGPSGTLALITSGNEEVPMLRILERDGTVRVDTRLIRLGPGRDWVFAGPGSMTGLSFSADGRWLYLFNDDLRDRGDTSGQVWQINASTGDVTHVWQNVGTGMGGALRPDGTRYTFIEVTPDHAVITDFDLRTGQKTPLLELPNHVMVASLGWSPDGRRLVFSRFEQLRWQLTVLEPDGRVFALPNAGTFSYGAKFSDDTHVVFADEFDGRLQVFRRNLDSGALERVTNAPFGVVDPSPLGDSVAFINREGTQWSLDVAPLTSPQKSDAKAPGGEPIETWQGIEIAPVQEATAPKATPAPLSMQIVEPETPYDSFDHLWLPQLRSPEIAFISGPASSSSLVVGATLMGRDRLGKHSWLITGRLQPVPLPGATDRFHQVNGEYRNMTLAPWSLEVSGGYRHLPGELFSSAEFGLRRSVFATDVAFGARGVISQPLFEHRRFIGPSASVAYLASDSTQYAGAQRLLGLDASLAAYAKGLGSTTDMLDLSVGLSIAAPLPVSRRHGMLLTLRGRALPGAPAGALTVGGIARGLGSNLGNTPTSTGDRPTGYLPGNLSEAVRGYEDSVVQATAAAVGVLRYRYNFIIDRGFASTLYLFPSFFFRQVTLEAFGSMAVVNHPTTPTLRAAGALVELKTICMGLFLVNGYYQFAYRFDGAGGPIHIFGLAFD